MDRQSYRWFHLSFVSNQKGTTWFEISLISFLCPLSVLVLAKLEKWLNQASKPWKLLIEFAVLAGPLLVTFTNLVTPFDFVFWFTILTAFINLVPNFKTNTTSSGNLVFLSNYRASMLLVTAICILGVDFQAFPRRFAKTEDFGFGLMDIGVGSFVFSAGTVSPNHQSKIGKNAYKTLPLLILGILKFLFVKMSNYHTVMSEYGAHWNFFITLAIVQLICGTCTCYLQRKTTFALAFILALAHELTLTRFHYSWILDLTDTQRLQSSFWIANAEGLVSLSGYAALYLMGSCLRQAINSLLSPQKWKVTTLWLVFLACIWIGLLNEGLLTMPSRRLCNLSYIIWMVVYNMMLLVLFSGVQYITGKQP